MKNILYKYKRYALLVAVAFLGACSDMTELDLTENPNALSPEQASADFFLSAIQVDFADQIVEPFGRTGAEVVRIDQMPGRNYTNAYGPNDFDAEWRFAYQRIMFDIQKMNALAEEAGLVHHIGMAQVIQAYIMLTLVDFFGDVPYTEALKGEEGILNPSLDGGASVYAAAISLLDAAILNFEADALADPELDFFYDGDWGKWIKAANTLKMKAYLATRLVDGSAISNFNSIVNSGNYISSSADDFQFRWGTNEIQPDTRHPRYSASYTPTGGGDYMSNYLMNYMKGKTDGAYSNPFNFDPRILYYYYRQVGATPGIDDGEPANEEKLECGLQLPPAHYEGYSFCGVVRGWWGRDHGNQLGIPPDGFDRTLVGVYPAGGALDDLSYDSKINGDGNGGNGITPVMLASWADFMIAETQMLAGDEAAAKTSMLAGVNKSIDKVVNFAPTTERFDWLFGTGTIPGTDPPEQGPWFFEISDYVNFFNLDLEADWDAASTSERWDILAMQYFVACYGNGIDPYNFYRRTGYPTTLQPNLEPNPGAFIRSFYYPANFVGTNSNVDQKSDVNVQVFWDNNPASPGFPSAN